MRISHRSFPILQKLESNSLGVIQISSLDSNFFKSNMKWFVQNWKKYSSEFKKNVTISSKPFMESAYLAKDKLVCLYRDMAVNNMEDYSISGTYITPNISGSERVVDMIFQKFSKDSEKIETALFGFTSSGEPLYCYIYEYGSEKDFVIWVSLSLNIGFPRTNENLLQFINQQAFRCVLIDLFKKYAQVETKMLPAGQKVRTIDCNYKNDTALNITHLDSKWFTTLVKSDAFKVRGHFRLQPKKKDGEWTKELIWINEFQKDGYTAPARKLNHSDQ